MTKRENISYKRIYLSLFVILLPFLGFFIGATYLKNSVENTTVLIPPKEEATKFSPYQYNMLSIPETTSALTTFTDSFFHYSFQYPSSLRHFSLIGTEEDPRTIITFLITPHLQKQSHIQSILECEENNRITPSGTCTESVMGDIDIHIRKDFTATTSKTSWDDDKDCVKEIVENKIIYSCLARNVNGFPQQFYIVYPDLAHSPLSISVTTNNIFDAGSTIKTIIESLTLEPTIN